MRSDSASRVISGEKPIHRELERALADLIGTEDCLIYVSGHATNVSTIGHLLGREDVVLVDSLIHNSVTEGALRAGAARFIFPHNDWQALDDLLTRERSVYRRALVVLEGVFQALGPDLTAAAHPLGLPGRSSLFREERLRICLCAQRLILPAHLVDIIWTDEDLRQRDDDLSHSASSLPTSEPPPSPVPRGRRESHQ